jgi:hypothetical protein
VAGPVVCPSLKTYSAAFSRGLADEVEAMTRTQQHPLTRQALRDYATLRDQIRACADR